MPYDHHEALRTAADAVPTLTALDRHFSRAMADMADRFGDDVALAAALVSRAVGQGSVCFDLSNWSAGGATDCGAAPSPLTLATWRERLLRSGVVGTPGDHTPLVLDASHRLYLHRYWSYEQHVAQMLIRRSATVRRPPAEALPRIIGALFPDISADSGETHWQAVAAAVAAVKGTCVLSGGPGTGKTYTAVRTMGLLQAVSHQPLRMVMAAPTGKAAGRLATAVDHACRTLGSAAELMDGVPREAVTLHRLLGIRPGRDRPRFHRDNPLPVDVVVVDEASMIDISLMCRLLEAVPEKATLVLIGDRDQLSSVEAGAVFGDICRPDQAKRFTTALQTALATVFTLPVPEAAPLGPFSDCLVILDRVHRFDAASTLGRLFDTVNAGDPEPVLEQLASGAAEIAWHRDVTARACHRWLAPRLERRLQSLAGEDDDAGALDALGRWQVLCALNKGPWGVAGVNRVAAAAGGEDILHGRAEHGDWPPGTPILILQNDYELGVFNGDIGVVRQPRGMSSSRVVFSGEGAGILAADPMRLPAHTAAHGLTVHKSQGSEFDHVVLVLPESDSPVLSRELLYTGMTRTRGRLTVFGSASAISSAVRRSVLRPSGLGDALWT